MSTYSSSTPWIKAVASRFGFTPEQYAALLNDGKKFCGGCRQVLPRTPAYFYPSKQTADGLGSQCRTCCHAATALWREHGPNRENLVRPGGVVTATQGRLHLPLPPAPPKPNPAYMLPSASQAMADAIAARRAQFQQPVNPGPPL